MTLTGHLRFPFSTGSIHATSADPTAQPVIDPHYFEQDIGKHAHLPKRHLLT